MRIRLPFALFAVSVLFTPAVADQPSKVEFRRAETSPAKGLVEAKVEGTNNKVYLHKEAEIAADDIDSARVGDDGFGNPAIEFTLTKEGGKKLAKLSDDHRNKPLAIVVDGKVISAPIIRAKISEKALITGKFTQKEAEQIVRAIGK